MDPNNSQEKNLLETDDGKRFPADKMTLFRGIRVKDGDEENHGFRYDPLAPMDLTQTVTVAPGESAPVWVRFRTADVAPGVYKGVVRVIPLGERQFTPRPAPNAPGASATKRFSYRDTPFSFEVLPFALSPVFVTQHSLSQEAYSKEAFRQMLDSQVDTLI